MKKIRKALLAGLGAGVTAIVAGVLAAHHLPVVADLIAAGFVALAAAYAVYKVPNAR